MPCYDHRDSAEYQTKELSDKVNQLTEMLCDLCRCVESDLPTPMYVEKWYKRHKKEDERHKKEEAELDKLDKQ